MVLKIRIVFNIQMKIFCDDTSKCCFRCSARPLLHLPSVAACLWVCLHLLFLCFQKLLGLFCSLLQVIIQLHREELSDQFCSVCLKPSRKHSPVHFTKCILLLLSTVTSSINTSASVPLTAKHVHAITLPPPCLTDDVVCFRSEAVLFFSLFFFIDYSDPSVFHICRL